MTVATEIRPRVWTRADWQCASCDGTGHAAPYCETCDGIGIVARQAHGSTDCPDCGGAKCDDCGGTGQIP